MLLALQQRSGLVACVRRPTCPSILRPLAQPPARSQLLEQASSADGTRASAAPYDPYVSAAFGARVRPQEAQT